MPIFKFLLILSVIVYVLYKVGGFFFRAGAASQRQVRQDAYPPRYQEPKKEKRAGAVKGGEYIDYEEVK